MWECIEIFSYDTLVINVLLEKKGLHYLQAVVLLWDTCIRENHMDILPFVLMHPQSKSFQGYIIILYCMLLWNMGEQYFDIGLKHTQERVRQVSSCVLKSLMWGTLT